MQTHANVFDFVFVVLHVNTVLVHQSSLSYLQWLRQHRAASTCRDSFTSSDKRREECDILSATSSSSPSSVCHLFLFFICYFLYTSSRNGSVFPPHKSIGRPVRVQSRCPSLTPTPGNHETAKGEENISSSACH